MKRLIAIILFLFVLIQCQNSNAQTRVWKQLTGGWSAAATKLEAAPNGDLYAMIYGDEVSTEARMFKSVDHGGSWQRVTTLPNCSLPVACTAIGADGAFYFATGSSTSSTANQVQQEGANVYRSRDGGGTWDTLLTGTTITSILSLSNNRTYLFEGVNTGRDGSGVLSSDDDGKTWKPISLGVYVWSIVGYGDKLVICANDYSAWLMDAKGNLTKGHFSTPPIMGRLLTVVNLSGGSLELISSSDGYRSMDGLNWVRDIRLIDSIVPYVYPNLTMVMSRRGTLYLFDGPYINSSRDSGKHWSQLQTEFQERPAYSYGYALAQDSDGAIYGTDDRGIHKTTDEGVTWTRSTIPAVEVATLGASANGVLFAKPSKDPHLFSSVDDGHTWSMSVLPDSADQSDVFLATSTSSGMMATEYGGYYVGPCRLYEFDPTSNRWNALTPLFPVDGTPFFSQTDTKGNIYLGNFYISHDKGISWDKSPYPGTVSWPGFTATSDGYVFEASSQPVVYRSSDAGYTWQKEYLGVKGVAAVALASAGGGVIIAATDHNEVLRSNDNGVTWIAWSNGFNDSAAAMVITEHGEVFVAGKAGLHYCKLTESQWHDVDLGVPNKEVRTVVVHNGNDVLVGTGADGVFISRASESGIVASPAFDDLSNNYPNPFTTDTHFAITLLTRENIVLEVFNEIGQRIVTLANGTLDAGRHNFTFTPTIGSSIYLAVLKTPAGIHSLKMASAH